MELLVGTVWLRPYVFVFVAAFLAAGIIDLGGRRTLLFGALAWSVAWLAEFSSTRTGVPFGFYEYTAITRGREIFIADVPLMDSISFVFLAYGAFCLARCVLPDGTPSSTTVAAISGVLMMLLDVVMDPLAVRGDRWFLGHVFSYPDGGAYFGVPLSNFGGWVVVGTAVVGLYLALADAPDLGPSRAGPGVALYYTVLAFSLTVTAWIGEWLLVGTGLAVHAVTALTLWRLSSDGETSGTLQPSRAKIARLSSEQRSGIATH